MPRKPNDLVQLCVSCFPWNESAGAGSGLSRKCWLNENDERRQGQNRLRLVEKKSSPHPWQCACSRCKLINYFGPPPGGRAKATRKLAGSEDQTQAKGRWTWLPNAF